MGERLPLPPRSGWLRLAGWRIGGRGGGMDRGWGVGWSGMEGLRQPFLVFKMTDSLSPSRSRPATTIPVMYIRVT